MVGLRNVRYVSVAVLAVVFVIAWWLFIDSSRRMEAHSGGQSFSDLMMIMMTVPKTTVSSYILASVTMWIIMMLAMMLPAIIPLVLIFRKIYQADKLERDSLGLVSGFLSVWVLFSVVAALLQLYLHRNGFLTGEQFAVNTGVAGALVFGAGLYQFSPIKDACLSRCRSPLSFLMDHWDQINRNAFSVGFRHGLFCVGCCWVLMLLMFAGGVMSVLTMAVISIFILLERTLPGGSWVRVVPGGALLLLGVYIWFPATIFPNII